MEKELSPKEYQLLKSFCLFFYQIVDYEIDIDEKFSTLIESEELAEDEILEVVFSTEIHLGYLTPKSFFAEGFDFTAKDLVKFMAKHPDSIENQTIEHALIRLNQSYLDLGLDEDDEEEDFDVDDLENPILENNNLKLVDSEDSLESRQELLEGTMRYILGDFEDSFDFEITPEELSVETFGSEGSEIEALGISFLLMEFEEDCYVFFLRTEISVETKPKYLLPLLELINYLNTQNPAIGFILNKEEDYVMAQNTREYFSIETLEDAPVRDWILLSAKLQSEMGEILNLVASGKLSANKAIEQLESGLEDEDEE